MKVLPFFQEHPVFSVEELDAFLASQGKWTPRSRQNLLSYHRKHGRLVPVRQGVYAVAATRTRQAPPDPYLIAAKLARDAVLGFHSALELHGIAHSPSSRVYVLTKRTVIMPTDLSEYEFRNVRHPAALIRAGKEDTGVVELERGDGMLRVTDLERTLVDVLMKPDYGGGWEEAWRSLEKVAFFDLRKITEYVRLLGNASTAAKVGFFLDRHRERWHVEERHLVPLLEMRPAKAHYAWRSQRRDGVLAKPWNLMVPRTVFERSWEEA